MLWVIILLLLSTVQTVKKKNVRVRISGLPRAHSSPCAQLPRINLPAILVPGTWYFVVDVVVIVVVVVFAFTLNRAFYPTTETPLRYQQYTQCPS